MCTLRVLKFHRLSGKMLITLGPGTLQPFEFATVIVLECRGVLQRHLTDICLWILNGQKTPSLRTSTLWYKFTTVCIFNTHSWQKVAPWEQSRHLKATFSSPHITQELKMYWPANWKVFSSVSDLRSSQAFCFFWTFLWWRDMFSSISASSLPSSSNSAKNCSSPSACSNSSCTSWSCNGWVRSTLSISVWPSSWWIRTGILGLNLFLLLFRETKKKI